MPHDTVSDDISEMIDAFKQWLEVRKAYRQIHSLAEDVVYKSHIDAISFFTFQCIRQTAGTDSNGFPVIVVEYDKSTRYAFESRIRCVDVYYLDIDECRPRIAERVLNVFGLGERGWPYAVAGLNGLWYTNVTDAATEFLCLPDSPRIRNWTQGLLAVLQNRWNFIDVAMTYGNYTKFVDCPSEHHATYFTAYIFTDHAIERALDCDGAGIGPGFRLCDSQYLRIISRSLIVFITPNRFCVPECPAHHRQGGIFQRGPKSGDQCHYPVTTRVLSASS